MPLGWSCANIIAVYIIFFGFLGAIILIYCYSQEVSFKSPTGEIAHHLDAFFKHGKCYAVFDQKSEVEMPSDFCKRVFKHFEGSITGVWIIFSALLHGLAWRHRGIAETGPARPPQPG